ncbi:P-loop containing nucleoside triphosphate hydrolase protein [Schizopora paradoxa]|uniref:p-loop containing nucleoside triphosphate hydrolase protein n=1 Tax=Schizopora paradoxa TaxID=27342 RepID=A0A0H2RV06_9AGAM|nr:P-loop containing nucleoside triphosphate hydrolase protein [Schizopora paradoxa]
MLLTTPLVRLRTYSVAGPDIFSKGGASEFLAAATTISSIPKLSGLPEVVVAGRANAGKSTLLNAVMGRRDLVHTSSKAGRTKALNFFRVGPAPGQLILVDAPGYGQRGRPEWGELWDHYIQNRGQLRQIYLLLNAKHGVTEVDKMMLSDLQSKLSSLSDGKQVRRYMSLQPIITKIDQLLTSQAEALKTISSMKGDISECAPSALPSILTAFPKHHTIGVEEVRNSMLGCITPRQ